MRDDAAAQIAATQDKRHRNNTDQPRCRDCAKFVSKGDPVDGVYRYFCENCDRFIIEAERRRMASVGD